MIEIKLFLPTRNIKEINKPVDALKINEFLITFVSNVLFLDPIHTQTV
mgnify:CR=1 FL=1